MATKIKGEAIKEGSIPLEANAYEIRKAEDNIMRNVKLYNQFEPMNPDLIYDVNRLMIMSSTHLGGIFFIDKGQTIDFGAYRLTFRYDNKLSINNMQYLSRIKVGRYDYVKDKEGVAFDEVQYLSPTQLTTARNNIKAQEKLVAGVNIANVNGQSLLNGGNIGLILVIGNGANAVGSHYIDDLNLYDIDSGYTAYYESGNGYYDSTDELVMLCLGNFDKVILSRSSNIRSRIAFSYSGSTTPYYDYDAITSYYRAPNWILICRAEGYDVFNGVKRIFIQLKKVGYE